MQVKKQQLELDMEQWTGSKLRKEYVKAICCHPAYLTYMQSTSCEMPGWMKHKLESRLLGEEPLDESERREGKSWFKLNIQKTKIMASGPITSWKIDGEQCQTLFFGAPKSLQLVTAVMKLKGSCSLGEKQ